MRHPDYAFWSIVSLLAVLLPAPWHWRARNISTICLIVWLSLHHAITFANTLIWADNYADINPVWCDISARVIAIIPFAVPLCSLAQMRRLASVASPRRPLFSPDARKRRMVQELVLCLGCPLLLMPMLFIFQGHRYDILESIGPLIPDVFTWPTIIIRYILPVLIATAAFIYAALAVRWFFLRRSQFRTVLSGSGLTTGRYLRLLGLAITDSILVVFITLFNLLCRVVLFGAKIKPYRSWKYIHSNFSLISQFPEEAQEASYTATQIAVPFYVGALYAITFFAFFGFGEEAISEYLKIWVGLKRLLGFHAHGPQLGLPAPTLGSTIVTLTGNAWIDDELGEEVVQDKRESSPSAAGKSAAHQPRAPQSGIAVTVERSIV